MADKTNVVVSQETWRRLNSRKEVPSDSMDDIIQELLEKADQPEAITK